MKEMSIKEQSRQTRMAKELKFLKKKATRQGGELRGHDKARYRSLTGRLVKSAYTDYSEEDQE